MNEKAKFKDHVETRESVSGLTQNRQHRQHWRGIEDLESKTTCDERVTEFDQSPFDWIRDSTEMARREFLTIMGAGVAMATFGCARRPVHKIIPYVIKPEEVTPGIANWYATTCGGCSAACGALVKTREGRPIKVEGNPKHPLNRGALCARGQASIFDLYDPDRLKAPLAGSRTGKRRQTSWAEADQAIQTRFKELAAKKARVRVLSGRSGPASRRLVSEFLSTFSDGEQIEYEPLFDDEIVEARRLCFGHPSIPRYRFDRADLVISLGADFLGTWLSPVEFARDWVGGRKLPNAPNALNGPNALPVKTTMTKLISFEPTLTITGSNADERFAIRPGDELKVALALAHEVVKSAGIRSSSSFAKNKAIVNLLPGYTPASVAKEIGIANGDLAIKRFASSLVRSSGRSLIIGGGPQSQTSNSLALQIAINLLNSLLGNEGVTIESDAGTGFADRKVGFSAVSKLIAEMDAGSVDALIVHGANPVYTIPRLFEDALKKVPFVIVMSEYENETSRHADYVLATPHPLESWGDAEPRPGIRSIQQPVIAPMHSTRAFEDSILLWTEVRRPKGSSWYDYLRSFWKNDVFRSDREWLWEETLRTGVFQSTPARAKRVEFRNSALDRLGPYARTENSGLVFSAYAKVSILDGRGANNVLLQELPEPTTAITWDNSLNIAPSLAKKLGVAENDVLELSIPHHVVELPVHIQPGLHPSVVSAALGYGRRSVGKAGDSTGVDLYPFMTVKGSARFYSGQTVRLRKTGKIYRLASTQWHTVAEKRPIINDITLAQYRKNPAASIHTEPELRPARPGQKLPTLWPEHVYQGQRWGMTIDLNSCIGCGSCVIACQVENNVPAVGRELVRNSREMHWLRIDRYFSGVPERPDVLFQPMLCQHCDLAPCEPVCPVLASVHNDEGLNLQVYNRCVGTRYCENNCPYKVRRFNFFDYWKSYKTTMNLAWNPDVTVRSRGVMEKCTFCQHRIKGAQDQAKDNGKVKNGKGYVEDGAMKTACEQTCPTDAIVFGDLNDPNSRVSKLSRDPRAFRVLELQNTQPSITYLTKVRNKDDAHG